ncbi:hypothetical protein [Rhizobium sp. Root483D2]|uniref:hypothetical protein n=1 Tax=Rhizobium sp. Root483D2 TaxID=1736545 RepID=UPI0012E3DAE1|nr:hypothetical protein [Rhizobium sp. Root483D2]
MTNFSTSNRLECHQLLSVPHGDQLPTCYGAEDDLRVARLATDQPPLAARYAAVRREDAVRLNTPGIPHGSYKNLEQGHEPQLPDRYAAKNRPEKFGVPKSDKNIVFLTSIDVSPGFETLRFNPAEIPQAT